MFYFHFYFIASQNVALVDAATQEVEQALGDVGGEKVSAAAPSPKTKTVKISPFTKNLEAPANSAVTPAMKSVKNRNSTPFPTKGFLFNDGNLLSLDSEEEEFEALTPRVDQGPDMSPLSTTSTRLPICTPADGSVKSTSLALKGDDTEEESDKIPTTVVADKRAAAKPQDVSVLALEYPDTPKTSNSAASRENLEEKSRNKTDKEDTVSPTGDIATQLLEDVSPASTVYHSAVSDMDSTLGGTPHKKVDMDTPKSETLN